LTHEESVLLIILYNVSRLLKQTKTADIFNWM
jgi:hypothetical protein